MEALQIKLDGLDVLKDGVSGIYYTQKEWRNGLQTSDQANDRAAQHGRDVSPTVARVRVITLEGYVDRLPNPLLEQEATEYLEQLFCLQSDPSIIEPRTLYVKDIYNREWELAVKVKEPCMIEEGDGDNKGSHWRWRAVLESIDDPTYLSYGELNVSGIEGAYGGWDIPVGGFELEGGFTFSDTVNLITISPSGNKEIYPRFEITITSTLNSPLKIQTLGNGRYFSLDVSGVFGDVIIVDSQNQTATKNGLDITSLRLPGSLWPFAKGETGFLITDADDGTMASDFDVIIYYKNALL